MSVKWYQSNSKLFDEENQTTQKKKMDFRTSRLYLLGEYEDDFDEIGSDAGDWKPNERLIKKGWAEQ